MERCYIATAISSIIQKVQRCQDLMADGSILTYFDSPMADAYWLNWRAAEKEYQEIWAELPAKYVTFADFVADLFERGYVHV